MRLTLGKAKELLADHSPADKLEDRIVRSIERILVSGKFNGGMERLALLSQYGDITLPRGYRTVEGLKVDRDGSGNYRVRQLTNGWYEFLPGKCSLADTASGGYGMDTVRSLGDGHAIMHDLPTEAGTLQSLSASDGAYTITIYGRDSMGMPKTAILTNLAASVPQTFTKIERIHKEETSIVVSVQFVPTDTGSVNYPHLDLAIMEPMEEETFYRRYREDSLLTVAEANVIALTKVRFIAPTSDEDVLPITNITALGFEMDSIHFLSENDVSLSREYHTEAINLLNDELYDSHSVDEIPALRFHYPGGRPRLTSHY